MATKNTGLTGLRETVTIVRPGTTIVILGESFNPLNVQKGNPIWSQVDDALTRAGKQQRTELPPFGRLPMRTMPDEWGDEGVADHGEQRIRITRLYARKIRVSSPS